MTGIDTAAMISRIFLGIAMRATPPSARICAGTRSRAMTATAPACSAMVACSALVTSMMTPPFSISARPVLRRREVVLLPLFWDMSDPVDTFSRSRRMGAGAPFILHSTTQAAPGTNEEDSIASRFEISAFGGLRGPNRSAPKSEVDFRTQIIPRVRRSGSL